LDLASVAVAAGAALMTVGVVLLVASFVPMPYSAAAVNGVFLNETFVLGGDGIRVRCGSFPPGATLSIAIKVLSGGGIDFWVVDEFNHHAFPPKRNVTELGVEWDPPSGRLLCFVFDGKPSTGTRSVHAEITYDPVYGPAAVIELRKLDSRLQALGAVMLSIGVNLAIITSLLAGLRDGLREARAGASAKAGEVKQHGQQPSGARACLNTGP
jgi:hypothetical protein